MDVLKRWAVSSRCFQASSTGTSRLEIAENSIMIVLAPHNFWGRGEERLHFISQLARRITDELKEINK